MVPRPRRHRPTGPHRQRDDLPTRHGLGRGRSALQIRRRFTQPRHPWTNGKAERFNRTLQTEWAYSKAWTTNTERSAALAPWLEHYNTERAHTALAGTTPASRLTA